MSVKIARPQFRKLREDEVAAWRLIAAATASDALNRGMTLPGCIRALQPGRTLFGQARTVAPSPGDNSCVLTLAGRLAPGEVMVIAGSGPDVAMAGELVVRQCVARQAAGIVVDGAMRDGAVIEALDIAIFCRGLVPRGPVKDFGGFIDVPVGIGGVSIAPGDLILGDRDGVTVVPLARAPEILRQCAEQAQLDTSRRDAIARGALVAELFGVQQAEYID